MQPFEEAFQKAVGILVSSGIQFALIGGIAASLYRSERRTTDDIDFALGIPATAGDAEALIRQMALSPKALTKAQLDGGPRFALKRPDRSEARVVLGRAPNDPSKVGVDLLLPTNPWVPAAVERAQYNPVRFKDVFVPTITVEDLIIAKLLAMNSRTERFLDQDDVASIFRAGHQLDIDYLSIKIKEHQAFVPKTLWPALDARIVRIARKLERQR